MQDIKQTVSLDGQQALDMATRLKEAFAAWAKQMDSLSDSMSRFNSQANEHAKVLSKIAKAQDKIGAGSPSTGVVSIPPSAINSLAEATKHTEKLTVSWGTLTRVVATQVIVRMMSQFRNVMRDAASEAVDFQRAVAQAVTIGDGAGFDQIAKSVRAVSDAYNLPLLETVSGVYQSLGNQVGDFGQSLKFTAEAARFAKATNSTLSDSVDLLSAALKSYGLGVEDTNKVSSIFFSTIDKGRISAAELGNSYGRVSTIAADLGVSLEETGGALAAISVRGTKTSEALTQFRAILSALQKPSKAMAATLHELGFSSAEVAIKTLGLSGLLGELSKSTGGSAEEMATLFRNVRGLSGVTSLTSDDLKELSANINEMTAAGRNFNTEKFLQATATDAERVTAEFNKLKNVMSVELGQATLDVADKMFKLTGGAENLVAAIQVGIPAVSGLAAAMLGFKAQTIAANAELKLLGKSLSTIGILAAGFGAGASIGSAINAELDKRLFADLNALKAADKEFLEGFQLKQAAERDAFNATNNARVQAALQANRELNRIYLQDVENAKTAQQKKAAFDRFTAKSTVDEAALSKVLNRKLDSPDQVARGLIDAQNQAAKLRSEIDTAVAGERGISRLRDNMTQVFRDLDKQSGTRSVVNPQLQSQFAAVFEELSRLRSDGQITEQELQKIIALRDKLGTDASKGGFAGTGFMNINSQGLASSLNLIDDALRTLQEIQRVQGTIPSNLGQMQSQLQGLTDVLKKASPEVAFQNATQALNQGVTPAQAIAAAMEAAASAAERLSAMRLPQAVAGAQFGSYFANGGQARGVDTIPAMLSPGEMVVNRRSTSRFFSQLQAMNAGMTPVFRQNGGTVNNNHTEVGDINITTSAVPNAKQLAQEIQREIRKGSVRRF